MLGQGSVEQKRGSNPEAIGREHVQDRSMCREGGGGEVRGEAEAEAEQTWWDIAGHCMGFEFQCDACGGFSS